MKWWRRWRARQQRKFVFPAHPRSPLPAHGTERLTVAVDVSQRLLDEGDDATALVVADTARALAYRSTKTRMDPSWNWYG